MSSLEDPWQIVDPVAEWQGWWSERPADSAAMDVARTQGFVLLASQLADAGVTRSAARHRVATGAWVSPAHGAIGPLDLRADNPDIWTLRRRHHALVSAAGSLRRPGHVVSSRSAAVLYGLPTLSVPGKAELVDPRPDGLGHRAGAHLFGGNLPTDERADWWGAPVTTPERTLLDLARHGRRDGIVAADAALRYGVTSRAGLERALRTAVGWPYVTRAREIVSLADPRAESALESIIRLLMHDDGMPAPEPQFRIGGYRVDLALVEQRLVIEADGRVKYVDGETNWREKQRHEAIRRDDWRVERVMWSDTTHAGWPATSERLWRAIRAHKLRRAPRPDWS